MNSTIYLLLFSIIFFFFAFIFRTYLLWKNTGINPLTFDGSDDAHDFNGKLFKIITILNFSVVLVYTFWENFYEYLIPIWYLESSNLQIIGWCLLCFSLIWVIFAQLQMKDSWRIGIDYNNKTDLITHGLFSISRNPIFLGIMVTDLGFFLVIPNAITLLILVWSISTIHNQVRLEESFLKKMHGKKYLDYQDEVGRWF